MPIIENENKILTKVLGVNTRIDNEDLDKKKIRQVVLMEMFERPEMVDCVFLKKSDIWVTLDGNDFHLGSLRDKYKSVIQAHITKISRWEVTGGKELPPQFFTVVAGEQTPLPRKKIRGNFGLNICIELLGAI